MSLRLQLLAVGVVTLVLPLAGVRYVREMEDALREGLEGELGARATTVAAAIGAALPDGACGTAGSCGRADGGGTTIYARALREPAVLDGEPDGVEPLGPPAGVRFFAAVRDANAYVVVRVEDRDVVYQRLPGQTPYGDRIVLATENERGERQWWLFSTAAPGEVVARGAEPPQFASTGAVDARVRGVWRAAAGGYSLEMVVPLALVGPRLGAAVIDVDSGAAGEYAVAVTATWGDAQATDTAVDLEAAALGPFVRPRFDLEDDLARFARGGGRMRVLDADGWVVADAGDVAAGGREARTTSVFAGLLGMALAREDPPYPAEAPPGRIADSGLRTVLDGRHPTRRFGRTTGRDSIVAAAAPIEGEAGELHGAVLLEVTSNPILTLTNEALARLMGLALLGTAVAAAAMLAYATWLSLRVRRLAQAAATAVGPRGEIRTTMPGRAAGDEIGDLARSFGRLLERLREHTDYLRTLTSKLSHELRTPLAVVSTSLDNLEHEAQTPGAAPYVARLRQGAARLDAIVVAMSEATRLEQAIETTVVERFELAPVIESCCRAYQDVYPEREIVYAGAGAATAAAEGSPDLLAQLLDKLVDNAVSFSADGSRIDVALAPGEGGTWLAVTNRGSRLPDAMQGRLFDALVSVREHRDGRAHLGLGLRIVALIAEFHGGRAEADDLPDGSGVVFRVWLPAPRGRRAPTRL